MSVNTLINGQLVKVAGVTNSSNDSMQTDTMPEPSSAYSGLIYQYIGETTEEFTNGRFYKCEPDDGDETVELISVSDWNTLTTEEKQSKGLIAIQDRLTGFKQGILARGSYYRDTLLQNSTASSILSEAKSDTHENGTSVWENLTLSGSMNNNADGAVITDGKTISYDLTGANTPVTVYALLKISEISTGNRTMVGIPYAMSSSNVPNIFCNNTTVYSSVYGSDVVMSGLNSTEYTLYTIAIDPINKIADFYANGKLVRSNVAFSNSGGYIVIGAADKALTNVISCDIKYLGIVGEYESQNTIIANHQEIMSAYSEAPSISVEPLTANQNGVYTAPEGTAYSPVTVDINMPQIVDTSNFTKIWDSSVNYGRKGDFNVSIETFLGYNDMPTITNQMRNGWRYGAYYESENIKGAYGGYTFASSPMYILYTEFYIGRYELQNKSLYLTVEYMDENGDWNEIEDLDVSTTIPYPINYYRVSVKRVIYGIRFNHKKDPIKTDANNASFFGLLLYS